MEISTNNALTAVSYGAVGCVGAMAAANAVLVGAGAGAKAGAYVADYFKNESVAQNLRIKGDQLISLAGKYAATELKVAAALVAVGGSAALAHYAMDNEIPGDNDEIPGDNDEIPGDNDEIPGDNDDTDTPASKIKVTTPSFNKGEVTTAFIEGVARPSAAELINKLDIITKNALAIMIA